MRGVSKAQGEVLNTDKPPRLPKSFPSDFTGWWRGWWWENGKPLYGKTHAGL